MSIATIHEALTGKGQRQDYTHIVEAGDARLRTVIHFDGSYADQSRCHIDLWTPNGWTPVVSLASEDQRVQSLPSGYRPDLGGNVKAFRDLHATLFGIALSVIK